MTFIQGPTQTYQSILISKSLGEGILQSASMDNTVKSLQVAIPKAFETHTVELKRLLNYLL